MAQPPTSAIPGCPQRPLSGLRIIVTRPTDPHDPLAEQLSTLGAEVVVQPAIRLGPPDDWRPVDAALARLGEFDWLVFLSANGVRHLLDRLAHHGGIARLDDIRVAAIGPGTADELARHGIRAALVPEQFRAESLADALSREAPSRRFLLARASRGRELLAQQLAAAGATVEQVVVYASTDVERPDPEVVAQLRAGKIDWITVTSSAIGRSMARLFGPDVRLAKLASISPVTSATLRELGHEPAAEADPYTLVGLADAIVRHRQAGK